MDTAVWGSHLWKVIHSFALNYPEKPSVDERSRIKQFYYSLQHLIPCTSCAVNYAKHLKELPIENYLTDQSKLFEWTVKLHNVVNRELNKREWGTDEAEKELLRVPGQSALIGWLVVVLGGLGLLFLVTLIVMFRCKSCKARRSS